MSLNQIWPVCVSVVVSLIAPTCRGDLVATWNFGTSSASATASISGAIPGFTVNSFGIGNSLGTVSTPINSSSASSGYTGASGAFNIGNAYRIGALDTATSGYISFSVSNISATPVNLLDFDFGTRSTSTGPQAFTLLSSADNYAVPIMSGTVANNSTWSLKNNTFAAYTIASGSSVAFRLYGSGGSGSAGSGTINGRYDDIVATFVAVPEPSAILFGGLVCGVLGLAVAGRKALAWLHGKNANAATI